MKTSDFDYDLPPELIAQQPAARRDESRMLVVRRENGSCEHRSAGDLPGYLERGDLLVVNDTRVIPARLFGKKAGTGGKVELLLLEEAADGQWDALLRASRRPPVGSQIELCDGRARAEIIADGELGRVTLRVESERPFMELVEESGVPPLPPYISRKDADAEQVAKDRERYQTIYAKAPGAVAAPTAGLHFSEDLLERIRAKGIARTAVTLHVGAGTFRPVSVDRVEDHRMEEERYEVSAETADMVAGCRREGHRVVAVGSTSVRTLETVAREHGHIVPCGGRTGLFIRPPYEFRVVDVMLTNFHLPRSTLLMMVCAFAGRERVLKAYEEAVKERYRFYSYGDCMLLL